MTRKIAIGFVVYKPNIDQIERIIETSRLGFSVYVYDNSPEKLRAQVFLKNKGNIVYLTCGKNVGLGFGISSVCAQAYYDEHSALVFFDQDTVFGSETVDFIEKYYIENLFLQKSYSSIVFNAKNMFKLVPADKKCFKDVLLSINSGSLYYLENVKKMNWHNTKYFVDLVDYEFCLNSGISNYKIGEYSCTPGFDHSSEQSDESYCIFGKIYNMRSYPLNRILDTCLASLKLCFKSIVTGKMRFTWRIFILLSVYIVTQLFVKTIGWMFIKGNMDEY